MCLCSLFLTTQVVHGSAEDGPVRGRLARSFWCSASPVLGGSDSALLRGSTGSLRCTLGQALTAVQLSCAGSPALYRSMLSRDASHQRLAIGAWLLWRLRRSATIAIGRPGAHPPQCSALSDNQPPWRSAAPVFHTGLGTLRQSTTLALSRSYPRPLGLPGAHIDATLSPMHALIINVLMQ